MAQDVKIKGMSYSCQNLRGKWAVSQKSYMLLVRGQFCSGFWVFFCGFFCCCFVYF